jgi:spore coat protein CotH
MWVDPISKYQAKADAVVFGQRLEDVGFRMRGQFSLRNSGAKKPFKIDIDAYIDGQEYENLRQLMFLNSIGDPSLLYEKLAYGMMEFAGLPASHVAFVELWIDLIDDEQGPIFWGVYAMIERVDNKYIGNRFGRDAKGGNLYKASHAQRGPMDLVYWGDTIKDYPVQNGQYAYGKMNNEDEADYSDIVSLCRTVDGRDYETEEEYIAALENAINVDAFLRYIAVNMIIDNWDSYINTGNNFYLFNNPVSGRFEWIPWDLTWGGNPTSDVFTRAEFGMMENGAPLFDKTMQIEKYRDAYTAYLDLITRHYFTLENMSGIIRRNHNLIAPYIAQSGGDKGFFGTSTMFPYEEFKNSPDALINFVSERVRFLEEAIQSELSGENITVQEEQP